MPRERGIVVQVYSPLEQGIAALPVSYVPGGARVNKLWFQRVRICCGLLITGSGSHCATNTIAPSRRWRWRGYCDKSELISILSGATSPEQVRENYRCAVARITDDDALLMRQWRKLDNP